ncbi:WXG100 family type VII secretion target [Amycolatopsis sp. cg13]|uniref:WXG100 family type VII secretion target n=1 Tax=Amycolatopsis sp. cg13 TaxID=3238807 RepID=UPI003523BB16
MSKRSGNFPTFQEFQQLMNDPSIDSNTKRGLALRYFDYVEDENDDGEAQSYGFQSDDDRNHWRDYYKDKLSISEGDMDWEWSSESDVYDWYGKAKDQADKGAKAAQDKQQQAVDGDKQKLKDQGAKNTDTDPGVANSNEILDLGVSGLQPFRNLLPLYSRARGLVAQNLPDHPFQPHVGDPFDEQRDIPFDKFKAAAKELTDVNASIVDAAADQDNRMATVFANWSGNARDSAQQSWKGITDGTKAVEQTLKDGAGLIDRSIASIAKLIRAKCQWLQDYYITEYPNKGDFSPGDIDRLIRVAEMGRNASDDDFKHFVRLMPQDMKDKIDHDSCDLNDETKDAGQEWAKKWLAGFCGFMDKHVTNWQQVCEHTRTSVDQVWNELGASLGKAREDLFTTSAKPADQGGGKQQDGGGGQQTTPSSSGGGGKDSGMPSTGGSGPTPAAAQTPKMPETPQTQPQPAEGLNPVTHQPLEVDPKTGQPYPIDPKTGAALKPEEPETMTVEHDGHKISMSEPGKDGHMGISVDDGTGKQKTYDLDFGDQAKPGATPPGTPVPGQHPDPASGFGPQGTGQGHDGTPAQDAAKSHDGAQGHEGTQGSGQKYQPGPDGKIHIQDGKLSIVAERPSGADGPTVVTIDDGSGHPTKYTLGDDGALNPSNHNGGTGGGGAAAASAVGGQATPGAPTPPGTPVPDTAAAAGQPVAAAANQAVPDQVAAQGHQVPDQVAAQGHQAVPGQPAAQEHQVISGQPPSHELPATHEPAAAAAAAGPDDSTSAQSVLDPFSSDPGIGAVPHVGLGDIGDPMAASAGDGPPTDTSQLGTAPVHHEASGSGTPAMMGGGMMGGLGNAPGGGGEQERSSSAYRVDGGLFGSQSSSNRISGSLLDDDQPGRDSGGGTR